jgi:hypothetical protein
VANANSSEASAELGKGVDATAGSAGVSDGGLGDGAAIRSGSASGTPDAASDRSLVGTPGATGSGAFAASIPLAREPSVRLWNPTSGGGGGIGGSGTLGGSTDAGVAFVRLFPGVRAADLDALCVESMSQLSRSSELLNDLSRVRLALRTQWKSALRDSLLCEAERLNRRRARARRQPQRVNPQAPADGRSTPSRSSPVNRAASSSSVGADSSISPGSRWRYSEDMLLKHRRRTNSVGSAAVSAVGTSATGGVTAGLPSPTMPMQPLLGDSGGGSQANAVVSLSSRPPARPRSRQNRPRRSIVEGIDFAGGESDVAGLRGDVSPGASSSRPLSSAASQKTSVDGEGDTGSNVHSVEGSDGSSGGSDDDGDGTNSRDVAGVSGGGGDDLRDLDPNDGGDYADVGDDDEELGDRDAVVEEAEQDRIVREEVSKWNHTISAVADSLALDRRQLAEHMMMSYEWQSWAAECSRVMVVSPVVEGSTSVECLDATDSRIAETAVALSQVELNIAMVSVQAIVAFERLSPPRRFVTLRARACAVACQ